jgi:integrase
MPRKSDDPLWIGIRRHGAGWRAKVSCGRGRPPVERHFPIETAPREMQAWRADERAKQRLRRKQRAATGTFEADAARYLAAVTALPTYETRRADIQRWVDIFGQRRRDTITPDMIRSWRDRWLIEPRRLHPPPHLPGRDRRRRRQTADPLAHEPYSASTVNNWLRALSNLWTVLDGRRAPNPVRDVPEAVEPDALPRSLDPEVVEQILEQMPVHGRWGRGTSLTRIRVRIMAYTGLTPATLGRIRPEDVNLAKATILLRRRKKGKGAAATRLPLLPEAMEAFRDLAAADGWGPFSAASIRKSWLRARDRVTRETGLRLSHTRPYDLRHSFGTTVYRATRSLEAVRQLLQHTRVSTTERYTLDAVDDVLAAQMDRVRSSRKVEPDDK